MEEFISYLNNRIPLTEVERELIRSLLSEVAYPRKAMIQEEGEIPDAFYFTVSGLIRLFYVNHKGEDRTAYFFSSGNFVSDYEGYIQRQPSRLNLQAMEPSRVIKISRNAAEQLLAASPRFSMLAMLAMEDELITYQRMMAAQLTLSPEDRYLRLLEEQPEIFQRVSQRHLAALIGVQPESLSRIKQRIYQRKPEKS